MMFVSFQIELIIFNMIIFTFVLRWMYPVYQTTKVGYKYIVINILMALSEIEVYLLSHASLKSPFFCTSFPSFLLFF